MGNSGRLIYVSPDRKGFNTASYYPMTDFKYILLLSLGIYLFLIFLSIYREQKRM